MSIIGKKEKCQIKNLEALLLEESNKRAPDQEKLSRCKTELEELYAIKTEGARIRASVKWFEKGETPSKYFHNLDKHRVS